MRVLTLTLFLCVAPAFCGWQQEPKPAEADKTPEQPKPPEASKPVPEPKKPAAKPATPKKTTAAKPKPHPSAPPSTAAKMLDALDAALATPPGDTLAGNVERSKTRSKELRDRLQTGDDQQQTVAREAALLLARLYMPVATTPLAGKPEPAAPPATDRWRTFLGLLAILSPVLCVVAFWFGMRRVETGVRRSFREAGLL